MNASWNWHSSAGANARSPPKSGSRRAGCPRPSGAHLHATAGHHDGGDRGLPGQAGAAGGAPGAGGPGGARAQSGGRDHAPAAQSGGGWRGGGHDGRRARHAVRRGQSDLLGGGTAGRRVRREAARLGRPPPHSQWARGYRPSIRPPPASASSATSRQTRWSVPMQNSPDLLTRALQNPTLREAEIGRRRARDGTDGDVLAWVEATFSGSAFPPWRAVKGTWRRPRPSVMPCSPAPRSRCGLRHVGSGARRPCSRCSRPPTPSCLKPTSRSSVAPDNSRRGWSNTCTASGPPGRSPGRGWPANPASTRPPWPGATRSRL